MKIEETIDAKIARAAAHIKAKNEVQAVKDIEAFRKHTYETRKGLRVKKRGQEMRHVAEIPSSLFFQLPQSVQKDPKELQKWLETYGRDFMIVDRF